MVLQRKQLSSENDSLKPNIVKGKECKNKKTPYLRCWIKAYFPHSYAKYIVAKMKCLTAMIRSCCLSFLWRLNQIKGPNIKKKTRR